jgi:hypothetical protein
MVHRSEHLLVVHAHLQPGRLVLCAVIRGMLEKMLLCDSCDCGFHWYCVGENHRRVPRGTWHCPALVKNPPIIPTFKVGILAGQVTIPTY